ncbi:cation:dicarboxylate symporter family transporter [Escherichia coli]
MSQLATVDISKYQSTTEAVQSSSHGIMGTILSLVPTNIVASMAKGEMLPIIFFSVLLVWAFPPCPRRIVNRW